VPTEMYARRPGDPTYLSATPESRVRAMLDYRTDESNELIPSEADRRSPTKAGVVKAKEAVTP
jgi:hypothetical protein